MRYAMFSTSDQPQVRLGIVHGMRVFDARGLAVEDRAAHSSLLALIDGGPEAWRRFADAAGALIVADGPAHDAAEVRWHAPIPRPRKNVFCIGRNYAKHVREMASARAEAAQIPDHPVFFTKAATSVTGPFDDITWPAAVAQQVDWEAELGVILGVGGRDIGRDQALAHVFGYTVVNDVSARDLQKNHVQFFKGKSLDGFCPMGPVVVTPDEFGDPQDKLVSCRVNGAIKQNQKTNDMLFPVATIIETLSQGMTLEPGDVIATGTPEGVGMGRTPQEYLQDNDVLETEVEGIGVMRNRMRHRA